LLNVCANILIEIGWEVSCQKELILERRKSFIPLQLKEIVEQRFVMKTAVFLVLLTTQLFSQALFVAESEGFSVYELSTPLLPVKISEVKCDTPLKCEQVNGKLYLLFQHGVEVYDLDLLPHSVNSAIFVEDFIDITVIDNVYLFSKYKVFILDKNLKIKTKYSFSSEIVKVEKCGSIILVWFENGDITAYSTEIQKLWTIKTPSEITGMKVFQNELLMWTNTKLTIVDLGSGVPIYVEEFPLADIEQVESVSDYLVILSKDNKLISVSKSGAINDTVEVKGVFLSSYQDYLYLVEESGQIRVIAFNNGFFKPLHTLRSQASFIKPISATLVSIGPPFEKRDIQKSGLRESGLIALEEGVKTSPAVFENTAFISVVTGNMLIADFYDGKADSVPISYIITAEPMVETNGDVVIGAWDGFLYILSRTGDVLKSVNLKSNIGLTASETPGGICAITDDGVLYLLSKEAEVRWKKDFNTLPVLPPAVHYRWGIVTLDIYGEMRMTDFAGNTVWESKLPAGSMAMALNEEYVFVSASNSVTAVKVSTGDVVWQRTFDDSELKPLIVCDEEKLFVANSAGILWAIDSSNNVLWSLKVGDVDAMIITQMGRVLVFSGGKIHLVSSETGLLLQSFDLPYPVSSFPVMTKDGRIIVPLEENTVAVYNFDDRPASGWPMYLHDARHSGLYVNHE